MVKLPSQNVLVELQLTAPGWLALIEEKYDLVRCCPLLLEKEGSGAGLQVFQEWSHSNTLTAAQCEPSPPSSAPPLC